jgi:trehalose 6-phosphate phosphatase
VAPPPDATADALARALGPLRERPRESAVLCDLDGTLAPIVERPELAALPLGARQTLAALRDRVGLLAFVSGRALDDLERIVALEGCGWAGNHGMELRRPGGPAELAAEVAPHAPAVAAFAGRWPAERLAPHGVWLEDKGVTLSFHYRTAPDHAAAERFLAEAVAPEARAAGLATHGGRRVLEVRPPAPVSKGTAVRALLAGTGLRLACYLGDDRTDIDAFAALRALAAEGGLERSAAIVAAAPEVAPEVLAAADVAVDGPPGALAALRFLLGGP